LDFYVLKESQVGTVFVLAESCISTLLPLRSFIIQIQNQNTSAAFTQFAQFPGFLAGRESLFAANPLL
jgi:hypothetical protein